MSSPMQDTIVVWATLDENDNILTMYTDVEGLAGDKDPNAYSCGAITAIVVDYEELYRRR